MVCRFHAGNFDLEDARYTQEVQVDGDQIGTLIENNPRYTTRVIAEILKISQTWIRKSSSCLGPAILKRIVTRDEKWTVYNNVERKRSWVNKVSGLYRLPKQNFIRRRYVLMFHLYLVRLEGNPVLRVLIKEPSD